jgi:hypothetical protein|tara:strand:+ start:101 stop:295 length:195 start_codon:yes stop_codon:yes gene_type:complete
MDEKERDEMCLGFKYKSEEKCKELAKQGGKVVGYVMLLPSGKRVVVDCGRMTYWSTRVENRSSD